jgi:hypothetical protein
MIARPGSVSRMALVALLPLALGCGSGSGGGSWWGEPRSPLTGELIDKYGLKDDDFKQLQYYLSADLVLTRQVQHKDEKERVKGKLVERHGDIVEEVTVQKGTPGVCLSAGKDDSVTSLEISFEEGSSLRFSRDSSTDHFTVAYHSGSDGYEVDFAGNKYQVTSQGRDAYLEVGEESLNNAEKRQRSLPGRKLEDPPAPQQPDKH